MTTDNPMAAMLPIAQAKIEAIAALDEKLVKFHGTMAEWLKKGADTATATSMDDLRNIAGLDKKTWTTETFGPMSKATTYGEFVSALRDLTANVDQLGQDMVMAFIRANTSDATSEKALLEQRAALVKEAEAFILVLVDQKVDGADKLVVPDAPKAPRKGGGQPKGSSKTIRFYRLDGTEKVYPADSQQKASSVAWYQFSASVADLETAMKAAGWAGDYGKPWQGSITVQSKDGTKTTTKTIGWDITNPSDDETSGDDKDDDKEGDDK